MDFQTVPDILGIIHAKNDKKSFVGLLHLQPRRTTNYALNSSLLQSRLSSYFQRRNPSDLYCTLNTFFRPVRNLDSLRWLNALYIDLDCYKLRLRKDSVLYELEQDWFGRSIPTPSFVIDSGRGLYLIWQIEPVPSMALPLWSALQNRLFKQLKPFGADPNATDAARVLRVPGSINSKTGTMVSVLRAYPVPPYQLKDLKTDYLPPLPQKHKKTSASKRRYLYNAHSLYHARIRDLEKLCELRKYRMKNCREYLLFLYRYYQCLVLHDESAALQETMELNQKFFEPLPAGEVTACTRSAQKYYRKGGIKLTAAKIIEWLGISHQEQQQLQTLIGSTEKNRRSCARKKSARRNKNGLTSRELHKQSILACVYWYLSKGYHKTVIAERVGKSVKMVEKYIREIREGVGIPRARLRIRPAHGTRFKRSSYTLEKSTVQALSNHSPSPTSWPKKRRGREMDNETSPCIIGITS